MIDKLFASLFFMLAGALLAAAILTAFKINVSMPHSEISHLIHASFKFLIGAMIPFFIGGYILESSRRFHT